MNTQSRTINSIKNITTGFVGQFIQMILGFVSRTVFIMYLSAEYLGVNGLFTNVLSILSLAELGVGSAIIYALYKPLVDKDENQIASLMNFYRKAYWSIGLVVAVVGIGLLPFLNFIIKDTPNIQESIYVIYLFYLFNTVVTYFFSYKNSVIVADQRAYIANSISYAITFVQTIAQIIILVVTKNFIFYLAVQAIFIFAYNIIISITADRLYPFLKEKKKEKLKEGIKSDLIINIKSLMIIKLSGVLVNNTSNIIITYFSGLVTVGLCSNYNMLIGIVNNVLAQLFNGITASVGHLNAEENEEKKESFFDIINFANFWLFGFSTICIILLSNDFIELWLGDDYTLSIWVVVALAANFYILGMQNAVWTYKNTMGLFKYGRYLLLLTAAINLALAIGLGNEWGLIGILIASAIARLVTNVWYDPYAVYKYGLKKDARSYFARYIKFLVILIGTLIVTSYVCSFIQFSPMWSFSAKLVICVVLVNVLFTVVFFRTKEFKYVMNMVITLFYKLKRKKTGLNV